VKEGEFPEEPSVIHTIEPDKELKLPEVKIVNGTKKEIVIRRWRNTNDRLAYIEIVGIVRR